LLTGVSLSDSHNGFRILSRAALNKISITHDRMAHNSEIIMQLRKYNLKFKEFSVEIVYTRYGQGVGGGIKILKDWLFHSFSHSD
jgi:hypothetical protein